MRNDLYRDDDLSIEDDDFGTEPSFQKSMLGVLVTAIFVIVGTLVVKYTL